MSRARPSDEKVVIGEVIRGNTMRTLTQDVAMQESTMAHDEDLFHFWTGSTHVVSGWKEHEKCFEQWLDPWFKAVRTGVCDVKAHLPRSGYVAWYSATLDMVSRGTARSAGSTRAYAGRGGSRSATAAG